MKVIRWNRVIAVIALWVWSSAATSANPSTATAVPQEAGIWRQRVGPNSMSAEHERRLVESLRRITGLCELQFTFDGLLSIGVEPTSSRGAKTARSVIRHALHSGVTFVIEDHSGSDAVHFGQLESFWFKRTDPSLDVEIFRIRLDFRDFREMEASQPVRETFDEGFTLLHELLHGLGYPDVYSETEVGPCETIVNQARSELGLPLREQYLADAVPVTPQFTTLRLRFRGSPSRPGGKSRAYYLFFLVRDDLASLRTLAEAARATRVRQKANPDNRIAVKASVTPPAPAEPALTSPRH